MKDANLAIFAISFNQKHITAVSEVGADAQLAVFFILVTDFSVDYRMQRFDELNEKLELEIMCI